MPATIAEKFDSRPATVGKGSTADLLYVVQGTEDDAEVHVAVTTTIPAYYLGLVFQSYSITPQGGEIWDVSVRYGEREKKEPGDSSFSFDTSGGTQHVTQSLETVGGYAPPGEMAPDFKGAIGVTSDSVEGTDITVPVYSFSEAHYVPVGDIDGAYKAALFALTGTVNDDTFRGFAAGEVLFLGASGSQRGQEDWEITFRFAASPNVVNLPVGDITVASKKGWEYLWVRYADAVDADVLVKQPIAAYVERVYEDGDFSGLGIGS